VAEDAQESEFNMDHVALESPIATLRSMGVRANDQIGGAKGRSRVSSDPAKTQDPIACGVLTAKEAERAVEL
jgi:hypothetical protein